MKNRLSFLAFGLALASGVALPNLSYSDSGPNETMVLINSLGGAITPKSVSVSPFGLVSAHNMMYRHSVTIYDATSMELKATIKDSVRLSDFGYPQYSGQYLGSPVEGDFSPDGKYLYVTNYAMYGKGFNHEGHDDCRSGNNYDTSFVYRINLESYKIDAVYPVGKVPKVIKVTPDNKYFLVTNWCSYDLSVVDIASGKVAKTIPIGAYPRGIVITKNSKIAYVAQMGGSTIHKISLVNFSHSTVQIGTNPRAIVLSPDESTLYATLNLSGKVVALDLSKKIVTRSIKTGKATRSLVLSDDGRYLFVVNFDSDTVTKIRVSDFKSVQTIKVCDQPIGITYDGSNNRTWVACYLGALKIFQNN